MTKPDFFISLWDIWLFFLLKESKRGLQYDESFINIFYREHLKRVDMMINCRSVLFGLSILTALILSVQGAVAEDITTHTLLEKAEARGGSIRVIVRLKTDYIIESELTSSAAIDDQHIRIKKAQQSMLATLDAEGVSNVRTFTTIPFMAMSVDTSTLQSLLQNEDILSVEEDIPIPPNLSESIPFIKAPFAHGKLVYGNGVSVAILDTGVRKTHEFIGPDTVVSEACYSTNERSYGSTTLCPNGKSSQTSPGSGVNCPTSIYGCSHGTHVAGVAAGRDGSPGVGVAYGASIISIQVFSRIDDEDVCAGFPAPCALTWSSDQIAGLERVYALRNWYNIAAVNMSFGGGSYNVYCDNISSWNSARKEVIDNLRAVGIATVISAGNDGYDGFIQSPACISSAIAVGATLDRYDVVSSYSNYGRLIDLMAPGSDIVSSVATGDTAYQSYSGTSVAAPHVTGAFALLKNRYPHWTVNQMETWLELSGKPVRRVGVTRPRIDLKNIASWPMLPIQGEFVIAPIQLLLLEGR